MAGLDLLVVENGRPKRRPSADQTIDFTAVRLGASNLPITADASGFGFGSKLLNNVADAVADTDAASWGQIKTYVGSEVIQGGTVKQQLLTQQQLDDTLGIIPGTVFFLSAQPTANDTFVLKDATGNTETYTFKASEAAAFDVAIGATVADTMANLAQAITDDSSFWKSYYEADALASIYANGLVGVYRLAIDDFYLYATGTTVAGFLANYDGTEEYKSDPSVIAIPSSDPGATTVYSGFSLAKASLENGEIHNVLAEDKLYSWNGDFNGGVGEWFTLSEGVTPTATSASGGGTIGKVTADSDKGLSITTGVMSVKVDDSTVGLNVSGQLEVKSGGITSTEIAAGAVGTDELAAAAVTEAELASSVAGNGLTGGAGSPLAVVANSTATPNLGLVIDVSANGVAVKIDDTTIGVDGSSQLEVKDDAITSAKIASEAVTEVELAASVAGDGLVGGAGTALSVNVDDVGIEIAGDALQLKDSGVSSAKIEAGAVTGDKLASDVAGAGITTSGTGATTALDVNVDSSTLTIDTDVVKVADAGITETQLAASVAGDGLAGGAGTALSVNVDDVGIEIATDTLQLKDGGVATDKIADDAVTAAKINADVAGDGLVANGTSGALDVNVDGSTLTTDADALKVADAGITETQLATSVAGDGLAGGAGTALSVSTGDGIQIVSDAVAADYTKAFTNDNASSITVRQVVYVKSNGNVDLAQATVAGLADGVIGLVAAASIATTASGTITVRAGAVIGGFTGLTAGKAVYLSLIHI